MDANRTSRPGSTTRPDHRLQHATSTSPREGLGLRAGGTLRGGLVATLLLLVLLPASGLLLGGCRARGLAPGVGTSVTPNDSLHGRLPEDRRQQTFTFEGVEGSALDFSVVSDDASLAAPQVALLDPEGNPLDIAPHRTTPEGAATTVFQGVVLLRSGAYQVTVTPTTPGHEVFYRFNHKLLFPPVTNYRATLTEGDPQPIYISAPRGGMVTVRIAPAPGSSLKPRIVAVTDPWGGRALDPTRRPEGMPAPRVTDGPDGSLWLNFPAPIPGRYRIAAGAQPGQPGAAIISAEVRTMPAAGRAVAHPNRQAADYGVPMASGSASDPAPRR